MAEIALAGVGAAIGSLPGGISVLTGFQVGYVLGGILFPPEGPKLDRGRLDEIRVQNAQQGTPIPIVFGRNRVAGTIIWSKGLKETVSTSTQGGKGGGGATVSDYTYSTSLAVVICEGPITKIRRIWANETVIYDWRTGASPTYAGFLNSTKTRIYLGSQTLPDSAIEADKGVGSVPAFKGLAYVVFEDLNLTELGNQIPNFTFEVEPAYTDLRAVMENLAGRVGLSATDYDFAALTGLPIRGFVVAARTEAARAMETLAKANWFDLIESGGKIKAVIRNGTSVLTIPNDDIGASADGDAIPYVQTSRGQEVELPREFTVSYNSEAQDFQTFSQSAKRSVRYSDNQDSLNLPMALSDNYARFLADSLLFELWAARTAHSFTLPYKYLRLDPGDVITIPDESGGTRVVRILEINAGLLAEIEIKAVDDDPTIYLDPGLPAATPPTASSGVQTASAADFFILDTVAPYDSLANEPNIGVVAGRQGAGWSGGVVQVSPFLWENGSIRTNQIATFSSSCIYGYTTSNVSNDPNIDPSTYNNDFYDVLDRRNTITVQMKNGTLSSCTYNEMVQEGRNLAIHGTEIFQFQTATFVSGTTYVLSNLLRYRRGSVQTNTNTARPFVLIDSKVKTFAYNPLEINSTFVTARIVEYGRDYVTLPTYTNYGYLFGWSRRPLGPVRLRYTGDRSAGTANVTLQWTRRARINADLVSGSGVPWDEPTAESYRVEIWNDAHDSIINNYYATSESFVYTVAMQTADGVESSEFTFNVVQLTSVPGIVQSPDMGYKYVFLVDDIRY